MNTYRCRITVPGVSKWFEIQAESPEDAANSFHLRETANLPTFKVWQEDEDGKRHVVYFARVEVEGDGEWISRVYGHGIWRQGRVKPYEPDLSEIAQRLGCDVGELFDDGWEGDEERLVATG